MTYRRRRSGIYAPDRSITGNVSRRTALKYSIGATATAAFLAACGSDSGASRSGNGELSLWNFYGDDGSGDPISEWFVNLVDEWNANNDVMINLRYIPNSDYLDGTTLQTAFTAGDGPDIFLISPGDFLRFANAGVLHDLTPYMSQSQIDDFAPDLLSARQGQDGSILGLPMDAEPLAIYYSIDAFEEAGLSEGDLPTTWDEYADIADKLTTNTRSGTLFETRPGYYQNFTWYPFMWQGGGDVFDDHNSVTFDSEATRAALAFWGDLVSDGVAARSTQGDGANDSAANLGMGAVAMQQSGIWDVADMALDAPDFRYGVTKLPVPTGGVDVTCAGGWAMCANADGVNPDAAAEFIVWALASEDEEGRRRLVEWNTNAKTNLPTRRSVIELAESEGAFEGEQMEYFVNEVAPTARAEPRYPAEVYQPISDAIQNVQLAGADAAAEAGTAQSQIEQFIEGYDGIAIG